MKHANNLLIKYDQHFNSIYEQLITDYGIDKIFDGDLKQIEDSTSHKMDENEKASILLILWLFKNTVNYEGRSLPLVVGLGYTKWNTLSESFYYSLSRLNENPERFYTTALLQDADNEEKTEVRNIIRDLFPRILRIIEGRNEETVKHELTDIFLKKPNRM